MYWRVTRFCCTSGMCLTCRAVATGTTRKRIVHIDRLSEARAREIAGNWRSYDAKAEPMPLNPRKGLTRGGSHASPATADAAAPGAAQADRQDPAQVRRPV